MTILEDQNMVAYDNLEIINDYFNSSKTGYLLFFL
jgi:hypothetical protein